MRHRKTEIKDDGPIAAHVETVAYIVMRDQEPCCLVNVSGQHKGGVLLPGTPIISFATKRDAARAVERTERVRHSLSTSLVAGWLREKLPSFLAGSKFEVLSIARQK